MSYVQEDFDHSAAHDARNHPGEPLALELHRTVALRKCDHCGRYAVDPMAFFVPLKCTKCGQQLCAGCLRVHRCGGLSALLSKKEEVPCANGPAQL